MGSSTNRLASVAKPSGTRSITYDARGNTASETRPASVSVATTYDGYARLTGYTRTGDPNQTNGYNGLDDRVLVTSGTTTRRYLYDADGRLMGEYGANASAYVAETIWLSPEVETPNQPFGGDDGVGGYAPIAVATGTTAAPVLSWVHGSHLGVPLVYTTSTGAVTTPPAATLPGFPGQTRTFADLYYNRYRDYDPTAGRYVQADPIGLEGGDGNIYRYAGGNPISMIDPLGLQLAGPGRSRGPDPFGPRKGPFRRPVSPLDEYVRQDCSLQSGVMVCRNRKPSSVCPETPPPPPPPPQDWCGSKASNTEWVPDEIMGVKVGPSCAIHDACYSRNSRRSRKQCDTGLGRDIFVTCLASGSSPGFCQTIARVYYVGVRRGGRVSYEGSGDRR